MINVSLLYDDEKIALVCLYFARLATQDPRSSKRNEYMQVLVDKYGGKLSTYKNYMQDFDPYFEDNGRDGWIRKPIEDLKKVNRAILEQYKDVDIQDLEIAVESIIDTCKLELLINPFISLRIMQPETAHELIDGSEELVIDGVQDLSEFLSEGTIIFVALGGESATIDWTPGFRAIAHVSKTPYKMGYKKGKDGKEYFKFDIHIDLNLSRTIAKSELLDYPDTFGASYIGLEIRRDRTQAISKLEPSKAIAVIRAVLDKMPTLKDDIERIFSDVPDEFMKRVYSSVIRLVPLKVNHGESIESAVLKHTAIADNNLIEISIENEALEKNRLRNGTNILLYGVPGSGKSWTIDHEYCKPNCIVERLVFHPDYTNADFIGQIMPNVDKDKQVTYEFTPGPFTSILREAYFNPSSEYLLIIEEINRGNAPAIFGEVFQLLDRMLEDDQKTGFPKGTSEYGITNSYMAKEIYNDPKHKIRIPSNLTIIGTMNSSDQNVFTLDTAFQRRWKMRMIENSFDNVRVSLSNAEILDTGVTWKRFCETINSIIVGNKSKMASAEDKRLGVYFIHERDIAFDDRALPSVDFDLLSDEYQTLILHESHNDIEEYQIKRLSSIREALLQNRVFPEKVIKYLWDDAFKYNPEAVFDVDNMDSLEKVIQTFIFSQGKDRFRVFNSVVRSMLDS